jgi:alkylresorcinol/alkylpyrone synthase
MPELLSLACAVPPRVLEHAETVALLPTLAGSEDAARRFRGAVDNARIDRRHLSMSIPELMEQSGPARRARLYESLAPELAAGTVARALQTADVPPGAVQTLVSVSCTGYALPSIDTQVMASVGMNRSARRIPITELGCSAGVAALGIAADLLETHPGPALVMSVELCSMCLQTTDLTSSDVIGNVLFADAAAATVLRAGDSGSGPQILASRTVLFPDTTDLLGMRLTDTGLRLVLSPALPDAVYRHVPGAVEEFLAARSLSLDSIDFWIVHPGGPKILSAVAEGLRLSASALAPSWSAWRGYGNVSSATVFFIMDALREIAAPREGSLGLMLAVGPGLSCELLLLRAAGWLCRSVRGR